MKGIWSKCELAWNVDEDDSHSSLLIVLLVTLRFVYREQAIVTTHKQSLKRSGRTKKTVRKTSKPTNNSCNIKKFLTVPKLCEFGLIRKFKSRASICKKNQLNRSYKTQVMNKRSLNTICLNSNFKTFENMFELDYWIEEIITKKWALVSLNLDKRVKSYGYLKNQGKLFYGREIVTTKV